MKTSHPVMFIANRKPKMSLKFFWKKQKKKTISNISHLKNVSLHFKLLNNGYIQPWVEINK